jgi:hypothetical protein
MSDVIEKGTGIAPTGNNITVAPHAKTGRRSSASGSLPEPESIGSNGGDVGKVDGSVEWRKQTDVHARIVRWNSLGTVPDTTVSGYW